MRNEAVHVRLFFALPADGAAAPLRPVCDLLAAHPRLLKTVDPHQYHITLKFLGETGAGTCRRLREDARTMDPGAGPQPYTLRGLGAFPGTRRPRVLWCGLECDMQALRRIHESVEELSARHGFSRETRPFSPHLTLARVRGEAGIPDEMTRYLAENAATVYGESVFDRIVLFSSEFRRGGPVYTSLEEIRLG